MVRIFILVKYYSHTYLSSKILNSPAPNWLRGYNHFDGDHSQKIHVQRALITIMQQRLCYCTTLTEKVQRKCVSRSQQYLSNPHTIVYTYILTCICMYVCTYLGTPIIVQYLYFVLAVHNRHFHRRTNDPKSYIMHYRLTPTDNLLLPADFS